MDRSKDSSRPDSVSFHKGSSEDDDEDAKEEEAKVTLKLNTGEAAKKEG